MFFELDDRYCKSKNYKFELCGLNVLFYRRSLMLIIYTPIFTFTIY
jgi:hypothetical protein